MKKLLVGNFVHLMIKLFNWQIWQTFIRHPFSRKILAVLLGLILFLSFSALPSLARNLPQFPILDHQPQQLPTPQSQTQPSLTAPGLNDLKDFSNFANNFFKQQMAKSQVPGAVISVVKDGKIFFSKGYGYANLKQQIPVDPEQTIFRVASLSKLFTATATMQLYERGLIDLDEDVNKYLEGWQLDNPFSKPVTFARMMMHTDGTTKRLIGLAAPTQEKLQSLEQYLPKHMPSIVYPPGKLYSYSNHSIALLGYLVEKISHLPFTEYIEENILQPLQMQHSSFLQPLPPELADNLATGYQIQGGKPQPVPYLYLNIAPAAALSATANDMAHFMIAHLQQGQYQNTRILQPATVRLMHQTQFRIHPKLPGTGYSFRERLVNNLRVIGHLGSLRGYSSSLTLIPQTNTGIFIASNSFNGLHHQFITQFFDRYFPKQTEFQPFQSNVSSPEPLARFEGIYRDFEYPRETIAKLSGVFKHIRITTQDDGTLLVKTPRLFFLSQVDNRKLVPTQEPRLFRRLDDGQYVFFGENEAGEITHAFNPMYPKIGAYERVPWYKTINFHFGLLCFCVIFFVAAIISGIFTFSFSSKGKIKQKRSEAREVRSLQSRSASLRRRRSRLSFVHPLAGIIGLLNLVFLIGLPLYLWLMGVWKLAYGVPLVAKAFFVIPILTTVLSVVLLISTILIWLSSGWSGQAKFYYGLITLSTIIFSWLLIYWNLLGFQF